ncbi:MAG: hypothetical protein R3F59_36025 [Myxococcota bacterium]
MGSGTNGGGNAADQRKKRSVDAGASPAVEAPQRKPGNVFDALGNSGVMAAAAQQRPADQETSLLALAEAGSPTQLDLAAAAAEEETARKAAIPVEATPDATEQAAASEEDRQRALQGDASDRRTEEQQAAEQRAAERLEVELPKEEAAAVAAKIGVDPVLLTASKDLGSSNQAKEQALGEEGHAAVAKAIDEASNDLGALAMDNAAREMVVERVRESLEVDDILAARREGRMDDLVRASLRTDAVRSRDEVEFLLQQLAQDPRTLAELLAGGDPDHIAVELIEHLAVEMVELEDLYALAAYDHSEILKKVVLEDEAMNVNRRLSPLALRMGGFASVLYQMVIDELRRHPLPSDPMADGEEVVEQRDNPRIGALRAGVLALDTQLRLFRTASAA